MMCISKLYLPCQWLPWPACSRYIVSISLLLHSLNMIIYPLPHAVVVLVVTYHIIHVCQIFIKEYLPEPAAVKG